MAVTGSTVGAGVTKKKDQTTLREAVRQGVGNAAQAQNGPTIGTAAQATQQPTIGTAATKTKAYSPTTGAAWDRNNIEQRLLGVHQELNSGVSNDRRRELYGELEELENYLRQYEEFENSRNSAQSTAAGQAAQGSAQQAAAAQGSAQQAAQGNATGGQAAQQTPAEAAAIEAWKMGVNDETLAELAKYQAGYTPSAETEAAMKALQEAMAAKPGEYQQSEQVRQALAYLQQLQGARPGEYVESPEVIAAREALAALQGQKPQGYNSKYEQQLNDLMARIQNPEKFNYELNSDNLFKAYADYYNEMGRQAGANAAGQAAALTGGYGNSYGESVGQQQNQQYLLALNDKALELRDRAFQEYMQGLQNDKDLYGLLQSADATDYGRYRDTVGDWWRENEAAQQNLTNERNFDYGRYQDEFNRWLSEMNMAQNNALDLQNMDWNQYQGLYNMWLNEVGLAQDYANNERNFDMETYQTMLNYWNGRQQIENQAWRSEAERQEAIRQYEQSFAEQQRQFEAQMALGYAQLEASRAAASGGGGGGGSSSNKDAEWAYKMAQDEYNKQQDALAWQYKYDQLAYNEAQDDRKYYSGLVTNLLAQGKMPSDEMLAKAGLSAADAAMLMTAPTPTAPAATGGYYPYNPTPQPAETPAAPKVYRDAGDNYYTILGDSMVGLNKNDLAPDTKVYPAMSLNPNATYTTPPVAGINIIAKGNPMTEETYQNYLKSLSEDQKKKTSDMIKKATVTKQLK